MFTIMMLLLIWCTLLFDVITGSPLTNCPTSDIHFEKVLGIKHPKTSHPLLLYKEDNHTLPITTECLTRCHENDECRSFIIYYNISSCYWFKSSTEGEQEMELEPDSGVAWFIKTCLQSKCKKLWVVERIPGAILIGNDTKVIPEPISRTDCQQYCLNETDFSCKSAKFKIKKTNYGPNPQVLGRCTLSNTDRHLYPTAYRVSGFDEEYLENQCVEDREKFSSEFCSYEEYVNVSLSHVDLFYPKKTKLDCENLCENTTIFNCRGYSIVRIGGNINLFNCYLHSEDTKIHGPKTLVSGGTSTYFEKARCINITVKCSESYMAIRYKPEVDFTGRLYMQGFSDHPECFVIGQGRHTEVSLKLPILTGQCGITKVNGDLNRVLMAGTLILQYNSLIQTQGDRIIKVGCIFGNETKVLVGTGVTITSPNSGSVIINTTTNGTTNPSVVMKIVDKISQKESSDTQIGQELELIVEANTTEPMDIWAGHLVAMTEKSEESIFLLDDKGCPTNLNIFPNLDKTRTNNSVRLSGTFQAFKFASSPIVRFSVIVQFCPEECPPADCGNKVRSFGRRKREIVTHALQTVNGTALVRINRSEVEGKSFVINQMPLEFVMVVRDPQYVSDHLVYGDHRILVAGYDYANNAVCLDYSLVVGLIITWIIVQLIFIICCIVLVRRYKRYYAQECNRQSLEELHKNFGIGFSNLENRRVHWADHDEIT